jgi:hypothetical protein
VELRRRIMPSKGKAKGSAAERAVVTWLRDQGWIGAERTRAGWQDDRGDIDGVLGVTFEVKNQQRMELAQWVEELLVEMVNGRNNVGAVVHKRRGTTDVGDWYATMPVWVWAYLLKQAGY